jgi:lipopolysaccharide transport system permease protein
MNESTASDSSADWDLIIRPRVKWYQVDLKGVWQYRDLIQLFVRRDFVSSYKQTVLGPVWMLLQPLVNTLMFVFVFVILAHISTGATPPILFYMSAFIPWSYFADCVNRTSSTFTGNAAIFGKVYFPRLVTPISVVISNLIKFGLQMLLFAGIYIGYVLFGTNLHPDWHLLFFPILMLMLAIYGLSIGLIITSLTTKYRDLTFLVGVGIQFLMYASSVALPASTFGPRVSLILKWNPMLWIMEACRFATIGQGAVWNWNGLAYAFVIMCVLLSLAVIIFNRVEKSFMDTV